MLIAACTHQGRVRPNNEDSVFLPDGRENLEGVMIVADGMGGHNAGEIASRIAVEHAAGCVDVLLRQPDNAIKKSGGHPSTRLWKGKPQPNTTVLLHILCQDKPPTLFIFNHTT